MNSYTETEMDAIKQLWFLSGYKAGRIDALQGETLQEGLSHRGPVEGYVAPTSTTPPVPGT